MKRNKKNKKIRENKKSTGEVAGSYLRVYVQHLLREGMLIFTLAAAFFLFVALFSYHRVDSGWSHATQAKHVINSAGRVGAWISDLFLYIFGYFAYVFPLLLGYGAWHAYRLKRLEVTKKHRYFILIFRLLGFVAILSAGCSLISIHIWVAFSALPYSSGGILGSVIAAGLVSSFNLFGANLILIAILFIGMTLFSGFSWLKLVEYMGAASIWLWQKSYQAIKASDPSKFKLLFSWLKRKDKPKVEIQTDPKVAELIASFAPTLETPIDLVPAPELNMQMSENLRKLKKIRGKPGILPKIELLDSPPKNQKLTFDRQVLEQKSRELELRLNDFNVAAQVVAVHPGPVVTRYELQLAAGTKVNKITALSKDLARSLSVVSVRVVEVIPGKSVIGLELPNENRQVVLLKEVIASKQYNNARSALTLALGKDIAGLPIVVDLAKMPHLLVAGTTGSGKSVCLNAMLLSLLYKSTPDQLRLILIDPKMLELSIYDGIPHLLAPVVTDMRDAATALRWCVVEMERRYRLMASFGVRNIAGFNIKVNEAKKRGQPLYDPLLAKESENKTELMPLPQIVVLADEFADMMVVVGKKVETLISRLAQKARAAGIHLILATQRPSVDVITGLIKANIPTRIAFQVSSKVDSRTILDQQGADQLLGYGDMLYLPPGSGLPVRVHGAYVHDDEVHRVVAYLKEGGGPEYVEEVLDSNAGADASGYTQAVFGTADEDGEKDPLYDQTVDAVVRSRRVSISSVQRRFKIGYNRAARIVEAMEVAGVVSTMETNGNREVLAPPIKE